jgi:hypothetical protein
MSNLFTVAGTSTLPDGGTKVRFANDMTRVKVLVKGGHENIDLIELPKAMTKEDIVAYLIKIDFANGDADKLAAINAEAAKRKVGEATPKVSKKANVKVTPKATAKTKTAPKAKEVKATKAKIVPRPAIPFDGELEDAPF